MLVEFPVGSIEPNPHQPRVHFDEESLADLAALDQGDRRAPAGPGPPDRRRSLPADRRRAPLACRPRAGSATIPAIDRVRPTTSASVEQALVENLHRQDLTALEEAAAFQQLIEDFGLTHEQSPLGSARAARRSPTGCGCSQLPPAIQHLLADGRLSAGHARALLGTPDRPYQEQLGPPSVRPRVGRCAPSKMRFGRRGAHAAGIRRSACG